MKDHYLVAIETSCDETAVAILKNGRELLANVVSSQIKIHEGFGGVMPEIASRLHVEQISLVIQEALRVSGCTMDMMSAIAYTRGPGLVGSLHVGVLAAKTLAWYHQLPLIPVHHIAGHIYANEFVEPLKFPVLALVVSGGHTELVYMKENLSYEILGTTQDDAVGEAYDKVARLLGLGYPGGPIIDELAKKGKANYILPKIKTENPLDFSFSGLKSAVMQLIARIEREGQTVIIEDVAFAFQETALQEIMTKTKLALSIYPVKQLVVAGGVAANSRLRSLVVELNQQYEDVDCSIPPLWSCTDNAAMIAMAGYHLWKQETFGTWLDGAKPSLDL